MSSSSSSSLLLLALLVVGHGGIVGLRKLLPTNITCCNRNFGPMMTKLSPTMHLPLKLNPKKSKSFRIAPDGHWQARPFTDRFGSSEADVLYQFPLVQGGTNVLLPTRCVDELYVNTAYPRGVSRVRELVPRGEGPGRSSEYWAYSVISPAS